MPNYHSRSSCRSCNTGQRTTAHSTSSASPKHYDEAYYKKQFGIKESADPAELGASHPNQGKKGISLHFTSASPDLVLRYGTNDGSMLAKGYQFNARDTMNADCENRFHVNVTKLKNGSFQYDVTFDPSVVAARVDIGGKSYFVTGHDAEKAAPPVETKLPKPPAPGRLFFPDNLVPPTLKH